MSEAYRDPLAAAEARIQALERENEQLRRSARARPANAGELHALRLELKIQEVDRKLLALDGRLREPAVMTMSLPRPQWKRLGPAWAWKVLSALAVSLYGSGLFLPQPERIPLFFFGTIALVVMSLCIPAVESMRAYYRTRAEYLRERAALVAAAALARATGEAPDALGNVRVATEEPHLRVEVSRELDAEPAEDASSAPLPTKERQAS